MSRAVISSDDIEVSNLDFSPMLIIDLFNVHSGSGAKKNDKGRFPYVAASFKNNGIVGYVDAAKYPGGWLSLIKDGDGGAGKCFYQPAPFWPSNHVFALEPKTHGLTREALLCVAALITHQCFPKYSRGYAINAERLSRQKIMAPVIVDPNGNQAIDWTGIARIGKGLIHRAEKLAKEVGLSSLHPSTMAPNLSYQPMLVTDIFSSMEASAACYDRSKLILTGEGRYPFVSRTGENNGIAGFCGRQKKPPEPRNAIIIGLDTQTVTYQPTEFYTGQNIQVLRHGRLNVDSGLILTALIKRQIGKFSWGGNGATLGRLRKTHIMVPVVVNERNEKVVDWDGISQYGRSLRMQVESRMKSALEAAAP